MNLGRLDFCVSVKDINLSLDFYFKLGFEVEEGSVAEGWLVLSHGNFRIGLYEEYIAGSTLNFRGSDMDKLSSFLRTLGISPEAAKFFDDGTGSITVKDPDGYVLFFDTSEEELELGKSYQFDLDNIYIKKPELKLGRLDICLGVSDIKTSLRFYENLGFVLEDGGNDEKWGIVSHNNARLGLYEEDHTSITLNFRGGDVENIFTILQSKGIKFENSLQKNEDDGIGASLYDPDGNFIYFHSHPDERIG